MKFNRFLGSIIILLLLVSATQIAKASSVLLLVEIKARALNIRQLPTVKSRIIGSLKEGDQLLASPAGVPGWLFILTKGKKSGYISAKYVKIISVISTRHFDEDQAETKCNADTATLSLSIDDVELDCDERIFGDGFDSCEAEVTVSISSDCDEELYVTVECEAEFAYRTRDGYFEQTDSEDESTSFYVSYGHGSTTIEIDWSPYSIFAPVVRVRISDCSCTITSVSD